MGESSCTDGGGNGGGLDGGVLGRPASEGGGWSAMARGRKDWGVTHRQWDGLFYMGRMLTTGAGATVPSWPSSSLLKSTWRSSGCNTGGSPWRI